jgi:hypothetical protein
MKKLLIIGIGGLLLYSFFSQKNNQQPLVTGGGSNSLEGLTPTLDLTTLSRDQSAQAKELFSYFLNPTSLNTPSSQPSNQYYFQPQPSQPSNQTITTKKSNQTNDLEKQIFALQPTAKKEGNKIYVYEDYQRNISSLTPTGYYDLEKQASFIYTPSKKETSKNENQNIEQAKATWFNYVTGTQYFIDGKPNPNLPKATQDLLNKNVLGKKETTALNYTPVNQSSLNYTPVNQSSYSSLKSTLNYTPVNSASSDAKKTTSQPSNPIKDYIKTTPLYNLYTVAKSITTGIIK